MKLFSIALVTLLFATAASAATYYQEICDASATKSLAHALDANSLTQTSTNGNPAKAPLRNYGREILNYTQLSATQKEEKRILLDALKKNTSPGALKGFLSAANESGLAVYYSKDGCYRLIAGDAVHKIANADFVSNKSKEKEFQSLFDDAQKQATTLNPVSATAAGKDAR